MTDTQLAVKNYDAIRALARNTETVDRFIEILGSGPSARSFIASAMLAVANSKDLQECSPSSIFNSVMRAAALRLSCDPSTKQAHLVPFWNNKTGRRECQFIPGYVGIQNLALRTNKYRYMNPGRVYEGEAIEFDRLTGKAHFVGTKKSNTVIGYFHYFELHSGYSHTVFMTTEELREYGKRHAPKNPMWNTNFEAMALKTVVRQNLLKHGELDPTAREILEQVADETQDSEMIPATIDGEFTEDDDARAAIEAGEYQGPKRSETEIMNDLGFEQPTEKPAEPTTAPDAPTQYTGPMSNIGKGKYPAEWAREFALSQYMGESAYHVDGILRKLIEEQRIDFMMTADQAIDAVRDYLEAKKAE